MLPRRIGIGLALLTSALLAFLWLTDVPLGVPGEWVWHRILLEPGETTTLVLGCLSATIVGGALVAFVAIGSRRLPAATRLETAAWLVGLWAAGFTWLWAVQESPARVEDTMAKSAWVLYFQGTDGYFDEARYRMKDVASYLAAYEARMAQRDVLHFGTHPPGLILFHRGCIDACRASAALRGILLHTQPDSFRAALDEIARNEKGPRAIDDADRAALWLAACITQALAAATVVPIFLLVRRFHSRADAWWCASLWPFIPAVAIFLPKSDAMFPFFGATFLWLWLVGFRRGVLGLCALAGALFFFAMFLSLAILPIGSAAILLTIWETRICSPKERVPVSYLAATLRCAAALGGFAVPLCLLKFFGHLNMIAIWEWNYRNHAAFYEQYHRTYWEWLLINPFEVLFALGAPVAGLAVFGAWSSLREGNWRRAALGVYWCCGATWMLLWLSGKNSGEAARLWLVIMPWAVCFAAGSFSHLANPKHRSNGSAVPARVGVPLVVLQMVVCLGTVTRVTGFTFGGQ